MCSGKYIGPIAGIFAGIENNGINKPASGNRTVRIAGILPESFL
jgi:hypothetical protein